MEMFALFANFVFTRTVSSAKLFKIYKWAIYTRSFICCLYKCKGFNLFKKMFI